MKLARLAGIAGIALALGSLAAATLGVVVTILLML
jgi:hypothetical protein